MRKAGSWCFAAILLIAVNASANSAPIDCTAPELPVWDGVTPACIEPNVSCAEDSTPTYLGNGSWSCPTAGELRFAAGPQFSCQDEAVVNWNESSEEWECNTLSACESCRRCDLTVAVAKKSCVEKSRRKARSLCNDADGTTWRGEPVDKENRTCEAQSLRMNGKTVSVDICSGPSVDECVEGWMISHPGVTGGSSTSGSVSYKVGGKAGGSIMGIGVEVSGERATEDTQGTSYSAAWGSGSGFLAACASAAAKVADTCADCTDACGESDARSPMGSLAAKLARCAPVGAGAESL